MADAPLTPDQSIALTLTVAANAAATNGLAVTAGVDTAGQPIAAQPLVVQPDPANPTYLEKLRAAGL